VDGESGESIEEDISWLFGVESSHGNGTAGVCQ